MKYDATCDAGGGDRLGAEFVYFFFMKKYGLEKLADVHTTQLQLAMLHHGSKTHQFACHDPGRL